MAAAAAFRSATRRDAFEDAGSSTRGRAAAAGVARGSGGIRQSRSLSRRSRSLSRRRQRERRRSGWRRGGTPSRTPAPPHRLLELHRLVRRTRGRQILRGSAGFFPTSGHQPPPATPLHRQWVFLQFAMDGAPPWLPRPSPALDLGRRSPQLPATVVFTAPPVAHGASSPPASSASTGSSSKFPLTPSSSCARYFHPPPISAPAPLPSSMAGRRMQSPRRSRPSPVAPPLLRGPPRRHGPILSASSRHRSPRRRRSEPELPPAFLYCSGCPSLALWIGNDKWVHPLSSSMCLSVGV